MDVDPFICVQDVLVEPVRPLLTAEALQGSGGDYLSDDDHIQTTTEIARSQAECMDIRLTVCYYIDLVY